MSNHLDVDTNENTFLILNDISIYAFESQVKSKKDSHSAFDSSDTISVFHVAEKTFHVFSGKLPC